MGVTLVVGTGCGLQAGNRPGAAPGLHNSAKPSSSSESALTPESLWHHDSRWLNLRVDILDLALFSDTCNGRETRVL